MVLSSETLGQWRYDESWHEKLKFLVAEVMTAPLVPWFFLLPKALRIILAFLDYLFSIADDFPHDDRAAGPDVDCLAIFYGV